MGQGGRVFRVKEDFGIKLNNVEIEYINKWLVVESGSLLCAAVQCTSASCCAVQHTAQSHCAV
jgi:hypothetical protein